MNIMIESKETISPKSEFNLILIDFGLSVELKKQMSKISSWGTERYICLPDLKVKDKKEIDPYKIDLWSLGVSIIDMMTLLGE